MSGCSPVVDGCLIQGHGFDGVWDQGACDQESVIERTVISGNRGGLFVDHLQSVLTVRETTIVGNRLYAMEGFYYAAVRMEHCVIWGNSDFGGTGEDPRSWVLSCCLYPAGAADGGGFTFEGPQIHEDPRFCEGIGWEFAPTSEGDYSVQWGSPCLPENNPCQQQLGALGLGPCDPATAPDPGAAGVLEGGIEFTCALPVREELRFRTDLDLPREAQILDLTGRVVVSKSLPAQGPDAEYTWRLTDNPVRLTNGIYFLRVRSESGSRAATRKFIWLSR